MGQIITFYSYKGGVGRTMALSNVAVILSQGRYKVLLVDWDLEAPGLEFYFKDYLNLEAVGKQDGIIDLLNYFDDNAESACINIKKWSEFIIEIKIPDSEIPLHLITSGKKDENYFKKVRDLELKKFYEKRGGLLIEQLRNDWLAEYDYILIDSRTGITDTNGICTIQLPDRLVLLCTANEQSLKGIIEVSEKSRKARHDLPFDRQSLTCIPIVSRFDSKEEFKISQEWLQRFSKDLNGIYANWLPTSVNTRLFIEVTKIPYISYFSFGEKLPVIEQGISDPTGLGYAYENLAALIANNLEFVEKLLLNRDQYIRDGIGKRLEGGIFICYSHQDRQWVDRFLRILKPAIPKDTISIWDDTMIQRGSHWDNKIQQALAKSKVAVLMVSANFLASDFIDTYELPVILATAQKHGLKVTWIYLSASLYQYSPIVEYQAAHDISHPLDTLTTSAVDRVLVKISENILEILGFSRETLRI